jgi:hypothetical protein
MPRQAGKGKLKRTIDLSPSCLSVGMMLEREVHKLTIRAIERHFGNMQVCVYDSFTQETSWNEIGCSLKSLQEQP